jgi:hypothetical protein
VRGRPLGVSRRARGSRRERVGRRGRELEPTALDGREQVAAVGCARGREKGG